MSGHTLGFFFKYYKLLLTFHIEKLLVKKWKHSADLSPAGQTAAMNHQISSDKTYQMQTDSVYAPCVLLFHALVRPPCPITKQRTVCRTWVKRETVSVKFFPMNTKERPWPGVHFLKAPQNFHARKAIFFYLIDI